MMMWLTDFSHMSVAVAVVARAVDALMLIKCLNHAIILSTILYECDQSQACRECRLDV